VELVQKMAANIAFDCFRPDVSAKFLINCQ